MDMNSLGESQEVIHLFETMETNRLSMKQRNIPGKEWQAMEAEI